MTCIVAVAEAGEVMIGGDSAGSAGHHRRIRADEKVFTKGQFVMGFTSSFRMGQLLRYSLNVAGKPEDMDDAQYMSTWFVDAVRRCLKDGGFAKVSEGREEGGVFIVGYRGRIYTVESDFQVGIPTEPYDAVGCGIDYALGALHALRSTKLTPKTRVTRALDAASTYSGAVAPPYVVLTGGRA